MARSGAAGSEWAGLTSRVCVLQPGKWVRSRHAASGRQSERTRAWGAQGSPLRADSSSGALSRVLIPRGAPLSLNTQLRGRTRPESGGTPAGGLLFASCSLWTPSRPPWARQLSAAGGPLSSAFPGWSSFGFRGLPACVPLPTPRHGAGGAAVGVCLVPGAPAALALSPQQARPWGWPSPASLSVNPAGLLSLSPACHLVTLV